MNLNQQHLKLKTMGGELATRLFAGPNVYKTVDEWMSFFNKDDLEDLFEFLSDNDLYLVLQDNYIEKDVDKVSIGNLLPNSHINPYFTFDTDVYKKFWNPYINDYYIFIFSGLYGDIYDFLN